jgi:hypothetical protein
MLCNLLYRYRSLGGTYRLRLKGRSPGTGQILLNDMRREPIQLQMLVLAVFDTSGFAVVLVVFHLRNELEVCST